MPGSKNLSTLAAIDRLQRADRAPMPVPAGIRLAETAGSLLRVIVNS